MDGTTRPPPHPQRVDSDSVADLIDAVTHQLDGNSNTSVYRYLGQRLGIHPTTVLRYHRGRLRTAPPEVLAEVRRLMATVQERGELPSIGHNGGAAPRKVAPARVPSWRLAHLLDRIIEMLQLSEPSALHRLLARHTGTHPTTVLRFHRGNLRSAPEALLKAAIQVERMIRAGEAIRFPHGTTGELMVTRTTFAATVDAAMETGLFPDRNAMLHRVEDELRLRRGQLTRLYRCKTFRWVPEVVQSYLEALIVRCQYDPELGYEVGDRLSHHLFGAGTVIGKIPVDKVRVRFDDDTERILRERLRENGYWRQPARSPAIGEAYAIGYISS